MLPLVPTMLLVTVSVAVMVQGPGAVSSVALKSPVPLVRVTLFVKNDPLGSVVTKWTMPV